MVGARRIRQFDEEGEGEDALAGTPLHYPREQQVDNPIIINLLLSVKMYSEVW